MAKKITSKAKSRAISPQQKVRKIDGAATAQLDSLKHAYGLLTVCEFGKWRNWWGPDDVNLLRSRIELLTVLANILPRSDLRHLNLVVEGWARQFSRTSKVSYKELRASALSSRQHLSPEEASRLAPDSPRAAKEVERRCLAALKAWNHDLLNDPYWRFLPAIVPGEAPIEIDQVYVELFAISEDPSDGGREGVAERREPLPRGIAARSTLVSVPVMAGRTLEQSIVIGAPGSGKSTMIHWLAREVAKGQCPDFDYAMHVKLSAYADAVAKGGTQTLVEFFLRSVNTEGDSWKSEAQWLRKKAQSSRRMLLLLDGWDEVPVEDRVSVLRQIQHEQPYFVTIITSRASGLPRQLSGTVCTDFYRIAGLAPQAKSSLIVNLLTALNRLDLANTIQGRVENELDLREMATNPFLLGLLVRVLVRADGDGNAPDTLAAMYDQVTSWMLEHHAHAKGKRGRVTWRQLRGLQRLSHSLLFQSTQSLYLFCWRDLVDALSGKEEEPVLRGPFINRLHPIYDEYGFLHATIQEYFAALYAAKLPRAKFQQLAEKAFASASRLIVLEFLAGMRGTAADRLRKLASKWLESPDRFQQILLRVARLVAAGRWNDHDLANRVLDELWQIIAANDEMSQTKLAVEAFAAIDPVELCRRAKNSSELESWVLNCLVESLPPAFAREVNLIDLLPGKWQDYAGLDLRTEVSGKQLNEMRELLIAPRVSREKRYEAITFIGAVRDPESVPALVKFMQNRKLAVALREEAIDSLAAIATRDAVDALLAVITGDIELSREGMRAAASALRNTTVGRKALDPVGRDRLLCRLALEPYGHPQVEFILSSLEGHPIRDGAELISEYAIRRELSDEVSEQAVIVLATAANKDIAVRIVSQLEVESRRKVADAIVDLAIQRRIPLNVEWFKERISNCRDRVMLHRLLKRYVKASVQLRGIARDENMAFLLSLVKMSLGSKSGAQTTEMAKGLTVALEAVSSTERPSIGAASFRLAIKILEAFTLTEVALDEGTVLLAIAIVKHSSEPAAGPVLREALNAALKMVRDSDGNEQRSMRLACKLANCLVAIAPGELLSYPANCEAVALALRLAAMEQGWSVFEDRINDAEGNCVASTAKYDTPMANTQAHVKKSPEVLMIQLGDKPETTIRQFRVFHRIGLEYARGAQSLTEIARRFEQEDSDLPGKTGSLSKICFAVREFFEKQDHVSKPLFIDGKPGLSRTGLSPYGKEVWNRIGTLLKKAGVIQ